MTLTNASESQYYFISNFAVYNGCLKWSFKYLFPPTHIKYSNITHKRKCHK